MDRPAQTAALSRRAFLATAGTALVSTALAGRVLWGEVTRRHPQRGGVLLFGTRLDGVGLDSHRNTQYHVSHPAAALYTEGWNIVNVELPFFYLHEFTFTSAAVKALQGYQPGAAGALAYHGGGLRTAYIEA